jgi:anti-anti-sigma factor
MSEPDEILVEKARIYALRHEHSSIRLSCTVAPRRLVVHLCGALDTETSTDFFEFLRSAKSSASMEGGVSINLGEALYVSSTGIGVLSTAMMEYARERIPFTLRCVPEKVRAVFQLLGLWQYFPIDLETSSCEE